MTIEYKDSKRIITSPSSATSVQGYSQLNAGTNGWNIASGALDGERLSLQIVSGSSIIADPIKEIKMKLSKNSSPTDTFYVRVRNSSDTILAEASMDSSTISASLTEYTFTLNTGVILAQGDRINAEYTGSSGSGNVSCGVNNATEPSTVNCQKYDGSSYSDIDRTPDWQFDSSPSTTISILQDKPTDVQDNSILVEKDTAKRYWFEQSTPITFEDDYDSSPNGWTTGASSVITMDAAASKINFNSPVSGSSNTNEFMYKSLGTTLSTTKFVARFKFQYNTFGSNGVKEYPFVLSAGTSWALTANQDAIGVWVDNYSRGHARVFYKDGSGSLTEGSAPSAAMVTGTVYYMELVIDPTTPSATVTIRTGSHTGTTHSTSTVTIPSTISGLNTLQHLGTEYTGGTGYTYDSELSETKIYNAVTSVTPATWTMEPTFEDDFANATKWTQKPDSSPNGDWEITGGDMNVSVIRDNNPSTSAFNNNFTHDLEGELGSGNTASDTWVWRFKFTLEAYTNGANNFGYNGGISICNMPATVANADNNYYGINFSTNTGNNSSPSRMGSTGKEYGITFFDNAKITSGHAADHFTLMTTTATVNQVFYVEIIRNSLTLVTCNIYSDSTYSTLTETKTRSLPSSFANRDLRYIRAFTGGDDMSGGSVFKYKIDDMNFYNGVTSIN